jgi:hypothetical protein
MPRSPAPEILRAPNITQIPSSMVPMVDAQGMCTREWYRFLGNLSALLTPLVYPVTPTVDPSNNENKGL